MEHPYNFVSILLHTLPDLQGWQIIGIRHNYSRELIATITAIVGQETAESFAHKLAEKLALNAEPDID